ncbi:hypothetical protein [Streptomyces sp. NPDC003697]
MSASDRGSSLFPDRTGTRPFLAQRLREWSLCRAVTRKLPWQPDDLLASSNWLQLKTAAGTNTEAIGIILADAGRTKRIRNTAGHPQPPKRELKNRLSHSS